MTGAELLGAWLRSHAPLAGRVVAPEEALLTGRFARYAARRLTAFVLARGWATGLHILELTWLAEIFSAKSFVASLALQNVMLVLDAAYWGALEAMRRRARELGPSSEAAAMVTRWLTTALWAGGAIALLPIGRALWDYVHEARTPSMLHVYALACTFRLGADVVVRTYYSGVYAYRRVHRPLWSVFVGPVVLVGGTLALWRSFAGWSFPVALVLSVLASRALLVRFTRRAYRIQRVPAPILRPWAFPGRRPAWGMVRATALAALANTTSRLGGVVLLAAVIPSLSTTVDEAEVPIVEPFALALHLASPLLLLASQWGLVFYHDYKRIEDEGSAALAHGLHRRLVETSVLIGVFAWAAASALTLLYVPYEEIHDTLLALLPMTVGLSTWAALQLRGFARGDFARQAASALALIAVLVRVVATPRDPLERPPASWYLALGAGPWAAIAIHALLSFFDDAHAVGEVSSFATFARSLAGSRRDVVVWHGRVGRRAPLVAARFAAELGDLGAVFRSGNRLTWFDRGDRSRAHWLRLASGLLTELGATERGPGRDLLATVAREEREADRHLPALAATHARLFPEGFVVQIMRRAPPRFLALSPVVRQAIWRDALREHGGGRAQGRSGFHVTTFGPRGPIEALFVSPRPVASADAGEWRKALRRCGWQVRLGADPDIVER
ncbi:hypothetical protein BH11MYX4_BH11MYX4_32970 [soil metagenome]